MMAAIRPTQFSALKLLDPLDQQEEQGEDDDRYGHVKQVVHGAPYVAGHARSQRTLGCGPGGVGRARARPAVSDGYQSPRSAPAMAIEPRSAALQTPSKRDASGAPALPNRIHAALAPMRPSRGTHAALMRPSCGPAPDAARPRPRCGPAPPPMRPGAHAATDDPGLDEQIMHCRKQVTAA